MTYNVTPASPAFRNLRITGEGLGFTPKTVESKELRSDRRIADLIRVSNESGGTIPLEKSWGSLDYPYKHAMQSNWVRTPARDNNGTAASVVTSVVVTSGQFNVVTNPTPGTDYNSGVFVLGQLVRTSGFTSPTNNGLFRVSTGSATAPILGVVSVADAAPVAAARMKVVGFRGAAADVTATTTGLASTLLDFTTLGLVSGMWVKVGGSVAGEQFGTAANNGWARINGTITATALPLDNLPAGWSVDAGAGKTITVFTGDYMRDASVEQSMTLELQYQDLAVPEYDYLAGSIWDQLMLSLKSNAIIDAQGTLISGIVTNTTTRLAGATDIAAPSNDVLSTSSNVAQIAENGIALVGSTAVLSLDLTISNGIRRRMAVGSLNNVDIASGAFRVAGKLSMYYASNAIRTKILNGTASSLNTRIVDTTAPVGLRSYIIDLPRIKYEGGNPNVPGIDSDRTIDPSFVTLASPTFGYAMHLQRVEEHS